MYEAKVWGSQPNLAVSLAAVLVLVADHAGWRHIEAGLVPGASGLEHFHPIKH